MNKEKYNIFVISSDFNNDIVENLFLGVNKCFKDKSFSGNITRVNVPGAFELPYMAKQIVESKNENIDCIITLGCVIKGETAHFEYISNACTQSLANLTIQSNVPIMFGVITAYNKEQAIKRSATDFEEETNYNIGYNVASAAIKTITSKEKNNL
jgi:6,7-dimethyl-8-ribityllumazine synthase